MTKHCLKRKALVTSLTLFALLFAASRGNAQSGLTLRGSLVVDLVKDGLIRVCQ